MKILKRLFIIVFVLLILLIGAAFAIPYFFKDELVTLFKEEVNKTVQATVDFQDIDISLFRSFPNLSLRVTDYSVVNKAPFEGVALASGEAVDFTLDLMSVISSERAVEIKSVHLEKPDIKVYVLADGTANYDIALATEEVTEKPAEETDYSNVRIQLQEYSISGANILYDDKSLDVFLDIKDLNHSGSGDFTIDIYDLDTYTEINAITLSSGGITYLTAAKAELSAIFNIDQPNSKYTLKENELQINALSLAADGFVQLTDGDDIHMDLSVSTPQNEFKHLFSLIPNAYIQGYENVKANGQFALNGKVSGTYNSVVEQYPSFNFNVSVDDADVQYPDLPLGITNINTKMNVNSPGSDLNEMVIDVPRFSVKIGQNPFNAQFNLRTPISDPNLKADIKGKIDLGQLSQAFPMEGTDELNGLITADVKINARQSDIDAQRYEQVNMAGSAQVQNLRYQMTGLPLINIIDTKMDFTPQKVVLNSFDAKMGRSDVQATGHIDNILAYFSPEKTMRGNLKLTSKLFVSDEWIPEAEENSSPAPPNGNASATETEIFDRFDFDVTASVDRLLYDVYELKNAYARGNIKPNRMEINEFSTLIGDSDLAGSGAITNMFDYVFKNGILGGNLVVRSKLMNLNQFMTEEPSQAVAGADPSPTATPATDMEPILVPKNIDMDIDADIQKVVYTNLELTEVKGRLMIENESVILENTRGKALGGEIALNGGYNTQDPENPAFNLKYDLQQLSFQQAFTTFNTFQQLAPIGKYIQGNFNSSMIMDGKLGKDLMPKLNSLNIDGFLQTINAVINNFKPLQAVGNTLNVQEFKNPIKIDNTKNWFEVRNGIVEIKEFDYKFKDIAMTVGGNHGLDQAMDYKINAQIPRELIQKNPVGAAAASAVDQIQKEAAKLGVNFEQGKYLNVLINLTGSIQEPKVKVKFLGMDGEVNLADAAKDKAKEALTKQVDEKVQQGKEQVKEEVDKATAEAEKVAQEKIDQAKKEAEKKLGEAIDTTLTKKTEEVLGKEGQKTADEIKDKLEKWNPFGKKKDDKKSGGGN